MVVWRGLADSWEKKSAKGKGEKERYSHLNAEFQRIARRDKKAFPSDQCKEIEENNRMGKTRDFFKKIRDTKETFHANSVQFSYSVVSDSLGPHGLQHARPPCPSPTPKTSSNSSPSSWWCHPAISPSVIPFSSCPQSLPTSGSFPMSQLFAWGGPSTGVSASASFLPRNTQDWSPLEWTGWISLQSMGCSRVFSNTTVQKHQFFGTQLSS